MNNIPQISKIRLTKIMNYMSKRLRLVCEKKSKDPLKNTTVA